MQRLTQHQQIVLLRRHLLYVQRLRLGQLLFLPLERT